MNKNKRRITLADLDSLAFNKQHRLFDEVRTVLQERHETYGNADDFFIELAKLWSVTFKCDITAQQAILAMAQMKLQRLAQQSQHHDSVVDVLGYMAIYNDLNNGGNE